MPLFIFIIILIGLILAHEFGHFVVAKLFGIRVDEFGVGFPPRIASFTKGETTYSFNWLLVGGFVKIFGENAHEGASNPRSFAHKNRFVQAAVLAAGVAFNILLAWLLLSAGYMAGLPTAAEHRGFGSVQDLRVEVTGVLPDSPAQKVGLMAGDTVRAIQTATETLDTRTLSTDRQADAVRNFIAEHEEESLVLQVERGSQDLTFVAKPAEGLVEGRMALGVNLSTVGILRLPPHLSLLQGAILARDMTVGTVAGLGGFLLSIVRGTADYGGVAGPIGIAGLGATAVEEGFAAIVLLTALISVNLAVINLLPIPGLDGGRLLIVLIEGVLRRPISPRLSLGLTLGGFAFILCLLVLVSVHDIARLVG